MSTDAMPRGLADHLRAGSDDALAALLRARPDLCTPLPVDLSVLATRAQSRLSVARALDQLDRFTLQVLDAVRLLASPTTSAAAVVELVGDAAPADRVREALDRLSALAVLWSAHGTLHVVPAVADVTSPYPAGLGHPGGDLAATLPAEELKPVLDTLGLPSVGQPEAAAQLADVYADRTRLTGLIRGAPPDAQDVLRRLAAGPPIGSVAEARRQARLEVAGAITGVTAGDPSGEARVSPVRWLLAHGLLLPIDVDAVELPREVGLLVRDHPLGPLHPDPPTPDAPRRPRGDADKAAAGQAVEAVRLAEALAEELAADPPAVLRTGGLGVRELRRVVKAVEVPDRSVAVLLEVLRAAGLLAESDDLEPVWLPTAAYDAWRDAPAAIRWSRLATGWRDMTRLPGLVGMRDERDRLLTPLSAEVERASAPDLRGRVLRTLATLPAGTSPDPDQVVELVAWHAPRRTGARAADAVGWTLEEAALLGLLGRGALASYGRALVEGNDPADKLAPLLPDPLDHVLLQADLTVVGPGPLQPVLAAEMALVADVESAGHATVYRITPASVRRALDAGRTAAELHGFFTERSRTPVPQALTYLIDDVARRHGGLRAGMAGAYLRSEDTALLAEVLADRRCESLRLRRLAPTVLITAAAVQRLLEALQEAGYAPVAEDSSGAVVLQRPTARRAPSSRLRPARSMAELPAPDAGVLVAAVAALRRGDEVTRRARRTPLTTGRVDGAADGGTAAALTVLQQAARDRGRVALGYVDKYGATIAKVVRPVSLGAGYLRAEDDRTEVLHTFALHRITSATVLDDGDPLDGT